MTQAPISTGNSKKQRDNISTSFVCYWGILTIYFCWIPSGVQNIFYCCSTMTVYKLFYILHMYVYYQVIFEANARQHYGSDIALDDITFNREPFGKENDWKYTL